MKAKTFGDRLREIRLAAGISQIELSRRCGLHYVFVNQLENGKRNPSWETVQTLASALKVPVTDFSATKAKK